MDDIGLASAIMTALIVYFWLVLLFATLGSVGLYRLLVSRSNPSAGILAIIAWVASLGFTFSEVFMHSITGFGAKTLVMFVYAVFGVTALLICRRPQV